MAKSNVKTFAGAVRVAIGIVGAMFVVEGVDLLLQRQSGITLDGFGIIPRSLPGLAGIVFSPLLHASPAHLLANALPLFILLVLLFWDRNYHPFVTLCSIWFFSGLGTWLIGRASDGRRPIVHVGASSIIFGLVAYLIASGFLMRSWRSAIVAIVVLIAFGGIFYGVLPDRGPISWEGHLCGALGGIWAARRNHE